MGDKSYTFNNTVWAFYSTTPQTTSKYCFFYINMRTSTLVVAACCLVFASGQDYYMGQGQMYDTPYRSHGMNNGYYGMNNGHYGMNNGYYGMNNGYHGMNGLSGMYNGMTSGYMGHGGYRSPYQSYSRYNSVYPRYQSHRGYSY